MAQEQLAVLKHNDSTSVFYGQSAFEQAYTAATHGDIITLSDGIFSTPNSINKAITVRGNGAVADTARHSTGTYFMETFYLRDLGDSLHFEAEGICFTGTFRAQSSNDIKLTRCYIHKSEQVDGLQATNCVYRGDVWGSETYNNIYINCILRSGTSASASALPYNAICNNCIILGKDDQLSSGSSPIFQYNNCIVIKQGTSNDTILNGSLNNSILIGFTGSNSPASSGNVVMSLSDVFENWDGESLPTDLETYVLKSSVSDSIQGLDGTEVGIFGGFMPFDWRPSYSIIKRFNVANRTTADGKLSVDIEVISE